MRPRSIGSYGRFTTRTQLMDALRSPAVSDPAQAGLDLAVLGGARGEDLDALWEHAAAGNSQLWQERDQAFWSGARRTGAGALLGAYGLHGLWNAEAALAGVLPALATGAALVCLALAARSLARVRRLSTELKPHRDLCNVLSRWAHKHQGLLEEASKRATADQAARLRSASQDGGAATLRESTAGIQFGSVLLRRRHMPST